MNDHAPTTSPVRRTATTATALLAGGLVALTVSVALGLWATGQALGTQVWRVESVVAPAVVLVGAVAAAWVAASALLAGACGLVRSTGRAWRSGERAVQRWAPVVVRRALAVAVAGAVGLGGAVGAHAAPAEAPAAVAVDLGWSPTAPDDAGAAATPAPAPSPSDDPDGVAPTDDATPAAAPTADAAPGASGGPGAATPAAATATPPAAAASTPLAAPAPARPAADVAPAEVAGTDAFPAHVAAPVPLDVAPPSEAHPPGGTVVVRDGDTLWAIAARHLGADATDAQIAAAWPQWYAANAATIGADPDLVVPGQVLTVPTHPGGAR